MADLDCNNECQSIPLDDSTVCDEMQLMNDLKIGSMAQLMGLVDECNMTEVLSRFIQRQQCMNTNLINWECSILQRLNQVIASISKGGSIEVPRYINTESNQKLITPVCLGDVTDDTRIGIQWSLGSTQQINYYTVGQLKGESHISGINGNDTNGGFYLTENYTWVNSSNCLQINTVDVIFLNATDTITRYTDANNLSYEYAQNPDYAAQTNGQDQGINVHQIIVYDLVPIFG